MLPKPIKSTCLSTVSELTKEKYWLCRGLASKADISKLQGRIQGFQWGMHNQRYTCYMHTQEKLNISACVNGILYINGAREMGMHERIASVT